jgi:hypothetical protein
MLLILDVAGHSHGFLSRVPDPTSGLFGVLFLIQIADQYVGSFTGVRDCDGTADAAVSAGDQRSPALLTPVSLVRVLAVVRLILHFRFAAGHLLGRLVERRLWSRFFRIGGLLLVFGGRLRH